MTPPTLTHHAGLNVRHAERVSRCLCEGVFRRKGNQLSTFRSRANVALAELTVKLEQRGYWLDRHRKSKSSKLSHDRPNSELNVKVFGRRDLGETLEELLRNSHTAQGTVAYESSSGNHVLAWNTGESALRIGKNLDAPHSDPPCYALASFYCSYFQCIRSKTTEKDNDWNVSHCTMEKEFGESCERGAAKSRTQSDVVLPVRSVPLTATNVKPSSDLTLLLDDHLNIHAGNSFPFVSTKMTKTPTCMSERNTSCVRPTGSRDEECTHTLECPIQSTSSSVSYAGTIPRLVITPSPGTGPQTIGIGAGRESPDQQPDEESPCSDSGCGGSPVPSLSLRKLSNSSSPCLSSASSFEESEDDLTGSDLEPNSLSTGPYNVLGSPEDMAGVSIWFFLM